MSQIVYAALFVVFIGACALGLLLAVLAEVLSGRRRQRKRMTHSHVSAAMAKGSPRSAEGLTDEVPAPRQDQDQDVTRFHAS